MPQISPINWITITLIFILSMLMFVTILPTFNTTSNNPNLIHNHNPFLW